MKKENTSLAVVKLNLSSMDVNTYNELMKQNKDGLKAIVLPLARLLRNCKVEGKDGSNFNILKTFEKFSASEIFLKLKKTDLASVYAYFSNDVENLLEVVKLDSSLRKAWEFILSSQELLSSDVEEILGRKINISSCYTSSYTFVEALFFPLKLYGRIYEKSSYSYYDQKVKDYILITERTLRPKLFELFFGASSCHPIVSAQLPQSQSLVIENYEAPAIEDFNNLSTIALSGTFSSGYIVPTKIKKIQKIFDTASFTSLGYKGLDRMSLLLVSFNGYYQSGVSRGTDGIELIINVAEHVVKRFAYRLPPSAFEILLPAFNKFKKPIIENNNAVAFADIIVDLIQDASRGWLSLDNLMNRFLCKAYIDSYYRYETLHLFNSPNLNYQGLEFKDQQKKVASNEIDRFKDVDFPFVINWIKLLCAWGIVEIASLEIQDISDDDPLEGMRYIHLTSLGRFILGFDKTYIAPKLDTSNVLDLDEENGIITILKDNIPHILFLNKITDKISNNRLKLTVGSFFKGCNSPTDSLSRLKKLEKIFDFDKSEYLQKIRIQVLDRLACAKLLYNEYIAYQLAPGMEELADLLKENREIRENVILAEKGIFLVKRWFFDRFKIICGEHGFLFA